MSANKYAIAVAAVALFLLCLFVSTAVSSTEQKPEALRLDKRMLVVPETNPVGGDAPEMAAPDTKQLRDTGFDEWHEEMNERADGLAEGDTLECSFYRQCGKQRIGNTWECVAPARCAVDYECDARTGDYRLSTYCE